jgi:branched-chain amino acid transport system ATP-binding protein
MALLQVKKLTKYFGGLAAVHEVDLEVESQEIRGLIGPNGAGKSTFFHLISGTYKPSAGEVIFSGENITGLQTDRVAARGLIRTFQETTLFREMPLLESVILGFHLSCKAGFWHTLFNSAGTRREEQEIRRRALEVLEFFDLIPFKDDLAKNLPHGYQRALGVAMALAANPRMLLLDEPVTGMNPEETLTMMKHIKRIRDELKTTIILVEHDMRAVMRLSDKISVLNFGQKIAEGLPSEITHNPEVIKAYLGTEGLGGMAGAPRGQELNRSL